MKTINQLAIILLIISGVNWGLWTLFEFNLINYVFGRVWIDKVIYFFFGASAIYVAVAWKSLCCRCQPQKPGK